MPYIDTNWNQFKNIKAGGYAVSFFNDDVLQYRIFENPENRIAYVIKGDYSNMTEVTIPERFSDVRDADNPVRYIVKGIAAGAFENLTKLKSVTINPRSTLTSIGDRAFKGCTSLNSISLNNTIETIGNEVFRNCSRLISIVLPESVTTLGVAAFMGCSYLESVTLSNNITTLFDSLFRDCSDLASITLPENLTSIKWYAFMSCSALAKVTFNDNLITIGNSAFQNCSALAKVTFNDNLTTIGNSAFKNCSSLKKVKFNDSLISIGEETFYECASLAEVKFNQGLKSIGSYAFRNTDKLKSAIEIPGSVETIGRYPFSYVPEIIFAESELPIDLTGVLSIDIRKLQINRPFTVQAGGALSELTDLSLGNQISEIPAGAFQSCRALKKAVLPPSVETIGENAFDGAGLTKIVMGHNVKTIGENAFNGCPATTVYITAQTPPSAPNTTFSNYSGSLWLQGEDAIDAYYDAFTCWDRFNSFNMIVPTNMEVSGPNAINGNVGDQIQLSAKLMPEDVTLPEIFWRSTNPEIASVDANGLVTILADINEKMAVKAAEADGETDDEGTCKIIAESLYYNGPVAEFEVKSMSGIEEVIINTPSAGIDFSNPYEVYNIQGMYLGNTLDNVTPGIYILRQGNLTKKMAIR